MNNQVKKNKVLQPLLLLVLVLVFALVLLIYIAYVDAFQSYSVFLLDRLHSNAELIEHSIEPLLQAGLPLQQLVGFQVNTQPLIDNDDIIYDITIVDTRNEVLFANTKPDFTEIKVDNFYASSRFDDEELAYEVFEDGNTFQIRTPLDARFDQPGTLLISMPINAINTLVNSYMYVIIIFAAIIVIIYSIVLSILLRKGRFSNLTLNIIYNICFVVVAAFLIGSLVQIYSQGVQEKAKALADSLNVRLGTILDLDLNFEDIDGIDQTFIDYKILNPDIEYISLITDVVVAHTDPEEINRPYQTSSEVIEYRRDIGISDDVSIAVAIPTRLVFQRLIRNIKNFSVLFLASAFLSWLLLRILLYVYSNRMYLSVSDGKQKSTAISRNRALLDLAFPAFFLANFVEGLHISYLPQFLSTMALDAGRAASNVGGIYAVYWAMYALILIPAGRIARTLVGVRQLLVSGFIFIATSMILLATIDIFEWIYAIRALAGLGQGMVFIAIQSYLVQQAEESQRTEGVSIIVYGYNGGIISGTVIGALLVSSLGSTILFFISSLVALMMVWYSIGVIGKREGSRIGASDLKMKEDSPDSHDDMVIHGSEEVPAGRSFLRNLKSLIIDPRFAKTILCIGLLAKAVLAGVVFLILPQLLARLDYRQEDIGQILMFYAVGVLLVSRLIARYTDRMGNTRKILFFGAMGSAIGLVIISTAGFVEGMIVPQTLILIGGILILGLSHGFVHAPIVTHIIHSPVSDVLGRTVVASIYRFMERIGHVLGPLIFGQLLIGANSGISAILYVGVVVGIGSMLFYIFPDRTAPRQATK